MVRKQQKNTSGPKNKLVYMGNAPHQVAIILDGVVQDVIAVPERMCALLLSEPTFAYFNGSTLPQDSEGRNVIGQTLIDLEKGEWVHMDMNGTERREPVPSSPWEVDENE